MTLKEEYILREQIEKLVMETLDSVYRNSKMLSEAKEDKMGGKRKVVINWLKDPATNCAEIMRKLWHPTDDEEDAKRSYFYKCRDGKKNEAGVPYSFSDKEINKLYSIKGK